MTLPTPTASRYLECSAATSAGRVQEIVDSHLTRFGKREGVQFVWR